MKKQGIFHASIADRALFGGAKGGGKSSALVMDCVAYAFEYPGAICALFRETFADLEANLINEFKLRVPKTLYHYNETKHVATLFNGSVIRFSYIRNQKDAEKYQGQSINYIGVDELTKFKEEWIQELLSCMRSATGPPPRFRATANPGGIGHPWVKRVFIIPTNYGKNTYIDALTGDLIEFVPSNVYDNEHIMKNDPSYILRLLNLPEHKKQAFLEGDWDVYTGQGFPEWSYETHTCDDFEVPEHWPKWMGQDNGYTDPFYYGWLTVSPDGQVFLFKEFTRESTDNRILYTDQAKKVVEHNQYTVIENGFPVLRKHSIQFIATGLDAWSSHHRDISAKTLIDYYNEGGLYGHVKAETNRKLRKDTFHEYLKPYEDPYKPGQFTAKLQVFRSCKAFIKMMPDLVEEEDNADVIADCAIDHPYDGVGYGLIAHHTLKAKVAEVDKTEVERAKERAVKRFKKKYK